MVRSVAKIVLSVGVLLWLFVGNIWAEEVELQGVKFAKQKEIAGKSVSLNGVALRKKLGFVKVNVMALYVENTTQDPEQAITSQQVKQLYSHYMTDMATAQKLREGFIEQIEKANSPELVVAHRTEIEKFASWLDKDMQPGMTSIGTYVPGQGLTLEYQGQIKGTISDPVFAEMYFRANLGEKADANIREGLLGKK
jgi:hypothetical protein